MIKASELRIGNWVEHNDMWCYRQEKKPFLFQWNESDWYALGESAIFLENLNHIPLTPEILEKAGFKGKKKWLMLSLHSLCFHADLNTMNVGLYTLNDDAADILIKRIGYLHQLQNLYFSLTGKELEIKF